MVCARCGSPMFRSRHREIEDLGDYRMVTDIIINECPRCSVVVKVIFPLIPGNESEVV